MADTVNQSINDMGLDPQLLQQYSDQAAYMLPELGGNNQMNHNISPEQQIAYMQQIKNDPLTYNPNYIPEPEHPVENMSSNQEEEEETEYTEATEESVKQSEHFTTSPAKRIWNLLKTPLVVVIVLFILLIPRLNLILNKFIINIFLLNNLLFVNLIKSLFGGILFYLLNHLISLV